jgi:hypothetical protein
MYQYENSKYCVKMQPSRVFKVDGRSSSRLPLDTIPNAKMTVERLPCTITTGERLAGRSHVAEQPVEYYEANIFIFSVH